MSRSRTPALASPLTSCPLFSIASARWTARTRVGPVARGWGSAFARRSSKPTVALSVCAANAGWEAPSGSRSRSGTRTSRPDRELVHADQAEHLHGDHGLRHGPVRVDRD